MYEKHSCPVQIARIEYYFTDMFTTKNLQLGGSFDDSNNVVPMTRPMQFNVQTQVTFSMTVSCHGGSDGVSVCPTADENDPHFTFNLWVRSLKTLIVIRIEVRF